ncbi:MAG: hypothetical protein IPM29_15965 [Planctomycetes bacterium]|nr:hypothetical protein [Planctomycetota bacterium]
MSDVLERLLAPVTIGQFRSDHAGRRHLRVHRGDPHYYDAWFPAVALDALLAAVAVRPSELELMHGGAPVPVEEFTRLRTLRKGERERELDLGRVFEHYARGATIYIDRLDHHDARIAELCRALDHAFTCSLLKASVLATPRGSQGFAVHFDTHDVLVLQIAGRKQWHLHEAAVPLSAYFQEYRLAEPPPAHSHVDSFVLAPGDLLYMPRGLVHEARAVDGEPSLHITISLAVHTWCEYLETLVESAAARDERFAAELPAELLDAAAALPVEHAECYAALLSELLDGPLALAALDDLQRGFAVSRRAARRGTLADLDALAMAEAEARLAARPGVPHVLAGDRETVEVVAPERTLRWPASHREALRCALSGEVFPAGALPGLAPRASVELARSLIAAGLVVGAGRPAVAGGGS